MRRIKSIIYLLFCKLKYNKHIEINNWKSIIGKHADLNISENGSISIGKVVLNQNVHLSAVCDGALSVGNNVSFNRNCIVVSRDKIDIGDGCSFGPNVCIYDHDHFFDNSGFQKGAFKTSNVVIGCNVWLGAGCIILRGAQIGDGCVIGANCVIKGEIPANTIVKNRYEYTMESLH